jgi:hypothetical protein
MLKSSKNCPKTAFFGDFCKILDFGNLIWMGFKNSIEKLWSNISITFQKLT